MSSAGGSWVSDAQFRSIGTGLRILSSWTHADDAPEEALARAVGSERDTNAAAVGLATVARLLAIELAAASGRSERTVIDELSALIGRLQDAN
ncbi:hypothetical protein [Gordonia terrae]|uniref:hypothetical protein n=1 Tax=Gordonia terrae TaxID=2055 RepID=UPI003F6C6588